MLAEKTDRFRAEGQRHVLLVAPAPPPYGGMALQARLLEKLLKGDGNTVSFLQSNVPFPGWLGFLSRVPGLRTLARATIFLAKLCTEVRRAEVLHIFAASWVYFFVVVYPAVMVGRLFGKRVILNYRGGETRAFFERFAWVSRPVFALADCVTVPSEFLAGVIREFFRVPVLIVPNILDTSVFTYRARPSFRPKMVVTRHLEKMYDIETVLKTFQAVQKRYPEASLWIAGTGSQESYLRGIVTNWKLRDVRFLAHVPQRDLPAIFDQCDILLNASRVDNFPGALIEASAAGLVVVSTGAGGIPYIYQDGINALLVEPGDWEGLARAVEKVLEDRALASDLTAAATAVVRKCDWKEVRKPLYEGYGFLSEQIQQHAIGAAVTMPVISGSVSAQGGDA